MCSFYPYGVRPHVVLASISEWEDEDKEIETKCKLSPPPPPPLPISPAPTYLLHLRRIRRIPPLVPSRRNIPTGSPRRDSPRPGNIDRIRSVVCSDRKWLQQRHSEQVSVSIVNSRFLKKNQYTFLRWLMSVSPITSSDNGMPEKSGKMIALEGVDGSGKRTVARALQTMLKEHNDKQSHVVEMPNSKYQSRITQEQYLCKNINTLYHFNSNSLRQMKYYNQELLNSIYTEIFPRLHADEHVLCVNFRFSPLAHLRAQGTNIYELIREQAFQPYDPDLLLVLDCPVDVIMKNRVYHSSFCLQCIDQCDQDTVRTHMELVRQNYNILARENQRCPTVLIDTNRPFDTVMKEVYRHINNIIK